MLVPEPLATREYISCGTRHPRDVIVQLVTSVLLAPCQVDRSTSGSTNTDRGERQQKLQRVYVTETGPAPQILDWGAACPEKGPLAEGVLF